MKALVKAKNEEIFSLREKNRSKDIQLVLLKDSVKKTELQEGSPPGYIERNAPRPSTHTPNTGSPRTTTTPQVRTNQQSKNQLRTVLPVNSGFFPPGPTVRSFQNGKILRIIFKKNTFFE